MTWANPYRLPASKREVKEPVQSDEIAYLDQLYETVNDQSAANAERERCQRRFYDIVWKLWPEISATFDDDKHSL